MSSPTCENCREPLPAPARTGRPRKTCSKRCRDALHLERQAQRLIDSEIFEPISDQPPVTEASLRRITIEALADALDNKPPAPPEERLISAVVETRVLAWNFKRLSREVRPDLSWRAELMSDSMTEDLGRIFEGVIDDQPTK